MAKEFVCVRVQSMNGMNIGLFKFEYDLTWMSFFMDTNDRFYTRYGGRDDSDAESHLTKASLLRVMRQVLDLHKAHDVQPAESRTAATRARTPEDIPTMNPMISRRKDSKCIHCHDVKVASLRHLQAESKFRRDMVFTYPTPANLGILIDPDEQNRVASVTAGSAAANAGVRRGDVVRTANKRRILTFADFSRVLETTPSQATLPLELQRGTQTVNSSLRLSGDWRKTADPSLARVAARCRTEQWFLGPQTFGRRTAIAIACRGSNGREGDVHLGQPHETRRPAQQRHRRGD